MYFQASNKEPRSTHNSVKQSSSFQASKAYQIIARNMTAVGIHSTSPINSDPPKEDITMVQEDTTVENGAVHMPDDPMSLDENIIQDDTASNHFSDLEFGFDDDHQPSKQDALVEEILMAVEPKKEVRAVEATQPVHGPVATDWHAYYSTANKARKSIPKAHARNSSISATMDLPWAVDNTSSSPQKTLNRNPSLSIPPPPKAAEMNLNNIINGSDINNRESTSSSPKLHPLMTKIPPSSPAPYAHSSTRQAPSPYSSTSSSQSQSHNHSLTSPPGYTQNTHASFSTIQTNTTSNTANTSHPSTPTTNSISLSRPSSSYSNYSPTDKTAPPIPLYNTNTSPFYANSYSGADYSNSLFSPTFSFNAPSTPKTPASAARRGILDNDPSIYLRQDGENPDDDGSIWDTATKWARLAGNKLSLGGNDRHSSSARGGGVGPTEFNVSSGLWRMVGSLGENRKDMY